VDGAEALLERGRILAADRFDELIAEALGGQIEHLRILYAPPHFPGDGLQKLGFAEPDGGVDVERVDPGLSAHHGLGNLGRASVRHAVRRAYDEAVERIARIERRALEAASLRATHRRSLHA